ncbi:MAG: hypothetical protein E5W15_24150, partial [Mesorhizobium sp.]
MRYMLLIYNDEAAMANAPKEQTHQVLAAYGAYTEALQRGGEGIGQRVVGAGDVARARRQP